MRTALAAALLLFLSCYALAQQQSLPVSSTYEPPSDMTGGSGIGNARVSPSTARGAGSIYSERAAGTAGRTVEGASTSTTAGSTSYNFSIPLLHLPGRNGLDVDLTLYYNSQTWTIANGVASLNADRDFPNYGFRLGYGYLEWNGDVGGYDLTEADGTKRLLVCATRAGAVFCDATDGSAASYSLNARILSYKNGRKVHYAPFQAWDAATGKVKDYGVTLLRPDWIRDANGNQISIQYLDPGANKWVKGQEIDFITDTVGRKITFAYLPAIGTDASSNPIYGLRTITVGTAAGAVRTIQFAWWPNLTLRQSFRATEGQPPATISLLRSCTLPNGITYEFLPVGYAYAPESDPGLNPPTSADWGVVASITELAAGSNARGAVRSAVHYDFQAATGTELEDYPTYQNQTVYFADPSGLRHVTYTHAVQKDANHMVVSYTVTGPQGAQTTNMSSGLVQSVVTPLGQTTYNWSGTRLASVATTPVASTTKTTQYSYDGYGNVTDVTESSGGTSRRIHSVYWSDTNNYILDRPSEVTVYDSGNVAKSKMVMTYAPGTGNLTGRTLYADPASSTGAVVEAFEYDAYGRMKTATGPSTKQTWSYTDCPTSMGATDSYTVVSHAGNSDQLTTTAVYDCITGLLKSSTDANSQPTTYGYDGAGRIIQVTRPDQTVFTTDYDDVAALAAVTQTVPVDASTKRKTVTQYDGRGNLVATILQDASGNTINITDQQYDCAGRLVKSSMPYKTGTPAYATYSYDSASRLQSTTSPDGSTTTYYYSNNAVTATDPAGHKRQTISDGFGRVVQVNEQTDEYPEGSVLATGYERSQEIIIEDPPDNCGYDICPVRYHTETIYDEGAVSITVGNYTATTWFGQDSNSDSIAQALADQLNADANSPVNAKIYNFAQGPTIMLTAKDGKSSYTVSTSSTSLMGSFSSNYADPSNDNSWPRRATYYNYDALDQLVQVTQDQQQRAFNYDGLARLTSAFAPESGWTTYSYSEDGLQATHTDARNAKRTESYSSDGLHRLTSISYDVPSGVAPTPTVTFSYDSAPNGNGRIASVSNSAVTNTYEYDVLGQIKKATTTVAGISYPVSYGYDLAGDVSSITYPSNRVVNYDHNHPAGWLTAVRGAQPYLTVTNYNAAGLPLGFYYGNGVQAAFDYTASLQPKWISYTRPQPPSNLLSLTYGFGDNTNNGQIRTLSLGSGLPDVPTGTITYTYDHVNRLQSAVGAGLNMAFQYDRYGNRTKQIDGGYELALTMDPSTNRLGGAPYDAAGNLLNDAGWNFTYDAENRIVAALSADTPYTYNYDGNGLRTQVWGPIGTRTVYIFDGAKVIAEYAAGASPTSPAKEFVNMGGQLLAKLDGNGDLVNYYHPDHLSVRLRTDSSANVIGKNSHLPFGEAYDSGDEWKFTSYEREVTGLDYAIFRHYNSRLGRFMQTDPYGGSADVANPQSWNRYAYVMNDSTDLTDPEGMDPGWFFGIGPDTFGYPGFCLPWGHLEWTHDPQGNQYPECGLPQPWPSGGTGVPSLGGGPIRWGILPGENSLNFPAPPLFTSIWEDLLGLPHIPTMNDIGCNPICDAEPANNGTQICGDFYCDANGKADLTRPASAAITGPRPTNIEFDILLGGFYLRRINSNPFLRIGPGYVKGGDKILRVVSGGPKLPWWWHIWNGPKWPF